ncbi:MAG TPA: PEP-CTERM sorting domain-containing protein [Gemmatales bacterium]|nr:PEP-CTERM sorting domain-containing protein [Gemmatales bacterium]HMP61470.1 PEP-CTERM sorting domain-containing protein [Gemmatales bacterium]
MACFRFALSWIAFVAVASVAAAQPVAPEFSSRPGAPYTLYLNFAGFSYTGTWGGQTPGVTPAYNNQTGPTFTPQEQANIKNIWARVAEAYAPFNVNVTTVDPAVAAGQAATDLQRQNYYDATPRVMHTVIGAANSGFFSGAGGVSFVNVWSTAQTNGRSTNWTFTNRIGGYTAFHNIFTATAHENGHAANLLHQGDYIGTTVVNEYSRNNLSTVIAPTMGVAYSAARSVWRLGKTGTNTTHNDPQRIIASNSGMGGFVNDGIGRTLATATPLPLIGDKVDFSAARGIIVPVSSSNPQPMGVNNYHRAFFSFHTAGGMNTFTVHAGGQWITPGVADPGASLDATLRILDSTGAQVAISDTPSLSETLTLFLTGGDYYLEVSSAGGKAASLGPNGTWDPAFLYDMGSYFITGTVSIPEPSSIALLGLALAGAGFGYLRRQGRKDAQVDETLAS